MELENSGNQIIVKLKKMSNMISNNQSQQNNNQNTKKLNYNAKPINLFTDEMRSYNYEPVQKSHKHYNSEDQLFLNQVNAL